MSQTPQQKWSLGDTQFREQLKKLKNKISDSIQKINQWDDKELCFQHTLIPLLRKHELFPFSNECDITFPCQCNVIKQKYIDDNPTMKATHHIIMSNFIR